MNFNTERLKRPPTLSEYATAKKEYEMGVDKGKEDGDTTVAFLVDKDTILDMYWSMIPEKSKRKIVVGGKHDEKYRTHLSKLS